MIKKYIKKPVIIEAMQLTRENQNEVLKFMSSTPDLSRANKTPKGIIIHTLEGDMLASFGDYIIKGIHGEFYPCKPDIFLETYDIVEN